MKISIITVSYNAVNTIEKTISSIINQTHENIEYIIIDGGSNDGTIDIIKKYSHKIHYWSSEPDNGIYDAMNKGVSMCTGEYLIFMNSGDTFIKKSTLKNCCEFIKYHAGADIYYGNTILTYKSGQYLSTPENLSKLCNQMIFCHQSCLVRTDLQKRYPFNLNYKILADYYFFRTTYLKGYSYIHINIPISIYDAEDGVSSKRIKEMMIEYSRIINSNNYIRHLTNLFYIYLKSSIKKIVPYHIRNKMKMNSITNNTHLKKINNIDDLL